MDETRYTYGDSEVAAERLGVVAEAFEPTTRAFLSEFASERATLALDLGCGPGHTTRLLAEVLRPDRTIGLDISATFVERAKIGAPPRVEFRQHDAREVPFPVGPADLIFCRLLLAHLTEPEDVLGRWGSELRRGGLLLVEELDSLRTDVPAFREYLQIATGVVAYHGSELFAGRALDAMGDPPELKRAMSRVAEFTPANRLVVGMFGLNLRVLRDDPFVKSRWAVSDLDRLAMALDLLTDSEPSTTWSVRHIAYRGLTATNTSPPSSPS